MAQIENKIVRFRLVIFSLYFDLQMEINKPALISTSYYFSNRVFSETKFDKIEILK